MAPREHTPPIPMSGPDIDESDVQAVVSVLRSGRLALGPQTESFESALAEQANRSHAVAVNSGTAALHLIVRCLGIGPGDEVIVPSFTFAASVNAILYEGATPIFAEIEPGNLGLCASDVAGRISPNTVAIMGVDIFGHPANWDALGEVADTAGIVLIDDACEALGSRYRSKPVGSFGTAATFAFYPNKQITTGEGGALVTDDDSIADAARSLRNQGRDAMGAELRHVRLGFNYRMDEMSAALGVSQIRRLDAIVARRRRVAEFYSERLSEVESIKAPRVDPDTEVSWFAYVVRLEQGLNRRQVIQSMESAGVPTRCYFAPIHEQPYIVDRLGRQPSMPITERIAAQTLALPFHGGMNEEEVDRVVSALTLALAGADTVCR